MKKIVYFIIICFIFPVSSIAQQNKKQEKTTWYSFEEALELNKKEPKKIFVDVYTDWCGWCKKMDVTTFSNSVVTKYMNKYFYAVKLNAETKDTIRYNGTTYINPNPQSNRSSHQLAQHLLKGEMAYPTTVYLDEKGTSLGPVSGYLTPELLESILKYYGENHYKTTSWEDFQKDFKSEIK